jgi:hypothetical protein
VMEKKPECPGCGATDYDGDLEPCPFCDSLKCSVCDMGDDTSCINCEEAGY